ncbi:MAG: pyridoxal phosphate-dependent aminotransferase [Candidatus Aenigmatarchaeota archaeon]
MKLSNFFAEKEPSCIRLAQILFVKRQKEETQKTSVVNTAIGNVSLQTHPKMIERYLNPADQDLRKGVWKYTSTIGRDACNQVFINIIRSFLKEGNNPELYSLLGDGSSPLMKLAMLGVCGEAGTDEKPLLVLDPAYTNYIAIGREIGRPVVAVSRELRDDGKFTNVTPEDVEKMIIEHKPGALLIIPSDNPSGQLMRQDIINKYAELCLKHEMFLISDEAYRGLHYAEESSPTIWAVTNNDVPGIEEAGIRISLETMSKVFNSCGLRMGALITDNKKFHDQAVAANTTYLCSSVTSQHIVEGLAEETPEQIQSWVKLQRDYYERILKRLHDDFKGLMPGLIVSFPEASIYTVVDVRKIAKPGFDAKDFVTFCASKGVVDINGQPTTLLVAPMAEFYTPQSGKQNPGLTQMRIACVEPEDRMVLVPLLFKLLFEEYEAR